MKATTMASTGASVMKYRVGSIITCTQPGSSRSGAVGVVFFVNPSAQHRAGEIRYRVNWFISPSAYIRSEPDIGEYKSDWLENNSEVWNGYTPVSQAGYQPPYPVPEVPPQGRYMCVVEGGTKPPKVEHCTLSEAKTEAERLAKAHGGTVRVAAVVASVQMKRKVEYIPQWDEE